MPVEFSKEKRLRKEERREKNLGRSGLHEFLSTGHTRSEVSKLACQKQSCTMNSEEEDW
jgi:hypothetical protein